MKKYLVSFEIKGNCNTLENTSFMVQEELEKAINYNTDEPIKDILNINFDTLEVEEKRKPLDDEENFVCNKYGYCFYDIKNGLIYSLYVEPKYRNQGRGRLLLKSAIHQLHKEGYENNKIKIQVNPMEDNIDKDMLKKFYESFNLQIIE